MRRFISVVLLTLALLPTGARADDPLPDAATIRAKVQAASPAPPGYRETTVTVVSNGETRTVHRIERGSDWRNITERGPFHTESGEIKGEAWHQNDNGQSVFDQADPGEAKSDPTTTTITRVHTPVEAYVVAELNARGWGVRRYVDPATWHVVRIESLGPNGNVTTVYDDFREDAGRTFAHHWSTVSEYARTTSDAHVTAYDPSPVTDAELAMPESRRMLVEFPADAQSADLPVQFGQGHIFVRITINGRGLDFTLDTGASGITLDNQVARELGLTEYEKTSTVTAQRYTTARTIVPEMHVGKLTMHNVALQLVPDGANEVYGVKTVGLLGFDFLAELGVTIDYEHERVTVVPESSYAAPSGRYVIPLDVRIGDGTPVVNVTINGALSERFTIDTGGAGTLMIFDAFARKHPEALVDKGGGDALRQMTFAGIGGNLSTKAYQLDSVHIGPINMSNFVAYLVTSSNSYAGDDDGIVGPTFLRFFTVGLDYAKSRIYLVPNDVGRRAMHIRD